MPKKKLTSAGPKAREVSAASTRAVTYDPVNGIEQFAYDNLTLECERVEMLCHLLDDTLMRLGEKGDEYDIEQMCYGLALVTRQIHERSQEIRRHAHAIDGAR